MEIKSIFFVLLTWTLTCCVDRDHQVDKTRLLANDYRLFQGTPVWEIAKATQDENSDKIKLLLKDKRILINYKEPQFGQSLLNIAVLTRKYESVNTLLQCHANPDIRDNYTGKTPLMLAANIGAFGDDGDSRFLKLLLKHGANPNLAENKTYSENLTMKSPLLFACSSGMLEYVQILLKSGADINYQSKYYENALGCAIVAQSPEIVLFLLNHGINYTMPVFKFNRFSKPEYLSEALKMWHFQPGSEKDKQKAEIIEFLKKHTQK